MPRYPLAAACPANAQPRALAHSPRTILVLGGGAMHGMVHIGVIRALTEARIEIDAIVGTSIGALIGARWAMGASVRELEDDALSVTEPAVLKRNLKAFMIGGISQPAIYDGEHYRDLIQRLVAPATFASLLRPLRVNAMSLRNGDERWFGYGADPTLCLVDAIYASGALPLIFPPLLMPDGDLLVDGGLKTMVGLLEAIRWGARRIVAVDVSEIIDVGRRCVGASGNDRDKRSRDADPRRAAARCDAGRARASADTACEAAGEPVAVVHVHRDARADGRWL